MRVEAAREARGEGFRHVLGNDGRGAVLRKVGQERDEGIDATGRRADRHDPTVGDEVRRRGRRRRAVAQKDAHLRGAAHPCAQGIVGTRPASVLGLEEDAVGAEGQGLHGSGVPTAGDFGGDGDHGHRPQAHQLLEKGEPALPGAPDVECQDIGIERLDCRPCRNRGRGRPDDDDPGVTFQFRLEEGARGRGPVDHQDPDRFHLEYS